MLTPIDRAPTANNDDNDNNEKQHSRTSSTTDKSPFSFIDFVDSSLLQTDGDDNSNSNNNNNAIPTTVYPFAGMLQGSAAFISQHAGRVAVVSIPGSTIESDDFTTLMSDLALAWTLGMKLVLVVDNRHDTPTTNLRKIAQDAGHVRFEVERTLNRFLRRHGGMSPSNDYAPALYGNVVSGNLYTATSFVGDDDTRGYPVRVYTDRIESILQRDNDVVLLTTVGWSRLGDMIKVDGKHLAALVAAELNAHKLIYTTERGCMLCTTTTTTTTGNDGGDSPYTPIREMSLSFVHDFLDYHGVHVDVNGHVSIDDDHSNGYDTANEMLLRHLAHSWWALEEGTVRAHIVNPGDGAILEELFTSKIGLNTCVYHEGDVGGLGLDERDGLGNLSNDWLDDDRDNDGDDDDDVHEEYSFE